MPSLKHNHRPYRNEAVARPASGASHALSTE